MLIKGEMINMDANEIVKTPNVFISYSWSCRDRVVELAQRLMDHGVNVIIDIWELKEGQDKYHFMEQSVNNSQIDKVLIICDKTYTEKANNRTGGVGDETIIITPEIYNNVNQEKFIPIIYEVDENLQPYCPSYIKTRIFINLSSEDSKYEEEYEKLIRNIYDKPLYRKPMLGTMPQWIQNEDINYAVLRGLLKQINGCNRSHENKGRFLIQRFNDEFVSVLLAIEKKSDKSAEDALLIRIDEELVLRDIFIDYLEILIINDFSVGVIIPEFMEKLYNETHLNEVRKSNYDSEFYDFVLWELFICVTAVLLYYELYSALNKILIHTYFLRGPISNEELKEYTYKEFRKNLSIIEKVCKPALDDIRCISLSGDILVKREKKPFITKLSLSNADVFLYQIGVCLDVMTIWPWFPTTYYYCQDYQEMWHRLKSREYCKKIMPLFGVNDIDSLKIKIKKNIADGSISYKNISGPAPNILRSVKFEEIGSLA